ncbi:hypothetical protein J2W14_001075 [Pseudarthrobacter oxydans]|nr:hypothetical protein [Pseudarthrobacter oxydans]
MWQGLHFFDGFKELCHSLRGESCWFRYCNYPIREVNPLSVSLPNAGGRSIRIWS